MLSEQSNQPAPRRSSLIIIIVLLVFVLLAILVWRWFDYAIARLNSVQKAVDYGGVRSRVLSHDARLFGSMRLLEHGAHSFEQLYPEIRERRQSFEGHFLPAVLRELLARNAPVSLVRQPVSVQRGDQRDLSPRPPFRVPAYESEGIGSTRPSGTNHHNRFEQFAAMALGLDGECDSFC